MWKMVKGFLKLWLLLFLILIFTSCFLYRAEIVEIIKSNLWAGLQALMPVILIIVGIFFAIKNILK